MTVELRRLRYFVAVAEELHFRRAAERLHLAQPALSQQIRKLELELGVQLLNRDKRGVALTPPGLVLLDEARRLLHHAEEAARATHDASAGTAGKLRVGHLADAVPTILPRAIARFATRHPGVEVCPETLPARQAIEDVRAGRLDVALVGLPAPTDGLQITPVGVEETVAAVAGYHPLSGRPSIPVPELSGTELVMLPRTANPAFYDGFLAACREASIAPPLRETAQAKVELALLIAAAGAAIAILPGSAAEQYSIPGVVFRPLESPAPTTQIGLVSRSGQASTTVTAFLRLASARTLSGAEAALAAAA
jgi:DNA-binding transcriptional LysR family regulator